MDAAFDTLDECEGLIASGFSGMVAEEVHDIATALMLWKENNRRGLKRSRASLVERCITDLTCVQQHVANIQDEQKSILASSALCLLEGHAKRKQQKQRKNLPMPDPRGLRVNARSSHCRCLR